jgi:hypothetical protein
MKVLFKVRNVYSAVKPLYILSNILGLAPLQFKTAVVAPENSEGSVGLRGLTAGSCLYSLTVLLILMTFHCLSLQLKIQSIYKTLKYTYILTDSFNSVLTFATVCVSIVQGISFNRNKLDIIFSKINKSDKFTLRSSASDVHRKTYLLFVFYIILIALVFGFLCVYDFLSNFKKNVIIALTRYTSHIIRLIMNMQFISFNLLIKHRFDILNKQLISVFGVGSERELEKNLLDNIFRQSKNESRNVHDYINTHGQTQSGMYRAEYYDLHKKRTWKEPPLTGSECFQKTSCKSEDELQQLRINHSELCNIARLVVSTYGVYIVFELLNISADIITVLYFTLDFVISESYVRLETVCWCSSWLLLHAAKLIVVTRSCQLLTTSGNHTSVLVAKLILLSGPICSSAVTQLRMFAQQLLHTKLHASACDFFELNNIILGSVAKVAVSYVIVLLLNQKT